MRPGSVAVTVLEHVCPSCGAHVIGRGVCPCVRAFALGVTATVARRQLAAAATPPPTPPRPRPGTMPRPGTRRRPAGWPRFGGIVWGALQHAPGVAVLGFYALAALGVLS